METIYKENQLNNYEVNILGKKWNSIAQCCEYYKISYSSVCVYKWKERCNNDTAVLHFIESKKRNSFYYRKKKWNNIKECCIYYDLDYNLVIAYKSRMNVSPEEAIDGYIRSKKKREFPFQGVTYKSFSECCHAYGVSPSAVEQYRKQKKLLRRRGLIGYLKQWQRNMEESAFCFANIVYKNFSKCCQSYGVNVALVREYAKRNQVDLYDAFQHYIILGKFNNPNLKEIQSSVIEPITYKNIYYSSMVLCCEVLKIDLEIVYELKEERDAEPREIISFLDENDIRMERKYDIISGFNYNNVYYISLRICCRELGIKENSVRNWMWSKGCTLDEAINHFDCRQNPISKEKISRKYGNGISKMITFNCANGNQKTYRRTRNAIYDLRYHIVIMTASRKKIINQDIGESIKWKIQRLIEEREGEVLQYDYQEDYIHIYAVFRPDCSMTREIALLKGSLTCYLKQTYEVYINQNVPSGSIWEQGYFISSSDEISKETINQYLSWKIRNRC